MDVGVFHPCPRRYHEPIGCAKGTALSPRFTTLSRPLVRSPSRCQESRLRRLFPLLLCARETAYKENVDVYAVILREPEEAVWQKIREEWPDRHYILTDRLAFVALSGVSTADQICATLGISPKIHGLVIELFDSYQGYFEQGQELGEWLRKARNG